MSSSLLDSLVVTPSPDREDTYHSTTLWKPRGARGVFGGHVIALALISSNKTVSSGMGLHSQHCYFILPANPDITIDFKVERLRDGRSYATRLVRAEQGGKAVFILAASYATRVGGGVEGQTPFSFIPTGNDLRENQEEKEPAVSHSLRFALDSTKDANKKEGSDQSGDGKGKVSNTVGKKSGWRKKEGSSVPTFTTKWFIPFPTGVSSYENSIEEEVRWTRFLEKKGGTVDEKARRYIEEYIQVSLV